MNNCPACGYRIQGSKGIDTDESPQDGDRSICLACGSVNIFCDGGAAIRLPTADERAETLLAPEVHQIVATILWWKDHDPNWPRARRSDREEQP